jgi:hypothetical protein
MQKSNYNETNGIVVGPEISRIFAEIIFQDIDIYTLKTLKEIYNLEHKIDYDIKRYVDDYFIYVNDEKYLDLIHKLLAKKLEEYKLYFNESKTKKFKPPFISEISMAKIEISQLVERSITPFIEINHEIKTISIKRLSAYYSKSNYFISEVKKIIKQNVLKYEDVSSYVFSVFKKKLIQTFTYFHDYEADHKNIEEFLLYILDILFFLYAMSIKVNTTYTISKIIININKFIDVLSINKQNNIRKKIYDEIIFIIEKSCTIDKEISLEILNLLIASRGLGSQFNIPEQQLRKILKLEKIELLNYFQITSILYFCSNESIYSALKEEIIQYVIDLFKSKKSNGVDTDIFKETELSLLLMDILSCPFVSRRCKNKLMKTIIRDGSSKQIIDYVEKYLWFTNWNEISIEKLLIKKELKFGYEK